MSCQSPSTTKRADRCQPAAEHGARLAREGTMVFAPNRDIPLEPHEPAAVPRRPAPVVAGPQEQAHRVFWRAVVHMVDRDRVQTSWHLASCNVWFEPAAHCPY